MNHRPMPDDWKAQNRYAISVVAIYGDEPRGNGVNVVLTSSQMQRLHDDTTITAEDFFSWMWGSYVAPEWFPEVS